MRVLIFGFGYSAATIAERLRDRAQWIGGTVRAQGKTAQLTRAGVEPLPFDSDKVSAVLRDATHVVVSIPPGEVRDPVLARYAGALRAAPALRWIGYLSTVGVYGDHGGAWVDEDTPPRPGQPRTRARLAAEDDWRRLCADAGKSLAVFRISGIYGPGRNAFVNLRNGAAHRIVKPGHVINRIHVDDLADAVVAALTGKTAGIVNLADDEPAPPQDVVAFAAKLMGVAPPPEIAFADAALSPMARSFYEESRRVANRKLRELIGGPLRFPTYREGLADMWESDRWR